MDGRENTQQDKAQEKAQDKAQDKAREEEQKVKLLRIARMFSPHQDVPLMRQLCLIAIRCVQDGGEARG